MAENKIVRATAISNRTQKDRIENRRVQSSKEKFDGYNTSKWEHTYFNKETGGYVVTEIERITEGHKTKNNKITFDKEQEMSRNYANWGFQIEHLNEPRGEKSPDVRVNRIGTRLRVNGLPGDLKRLDSVDKVYKRAKEAIIEKKAKIVLFEFTFDKESSNLRGELAKIRKKGWMAYYYFSGENTYHKI